MHEDVILHQSRDGSWSTSVSVLYGFPGISYLCIYCTDSGPVLLDSSCYRIYDPQGKQSVLLFRNQSTLWNNEFPCLRLESRTRLIIVYIKNICIKDSFLYLVILGFVAACVHVHVARWWHISPCMLHNSSRDPCFGGFCCTRCALTAGQSKCSAINVSYDLV